MAWCVVGGGRAYAQLQPLPSRDTVPIADIRILGNRYIETETILNQIRIARGQPYSAALVEQDRQAILRLGFFAEVQSEVIPSALGMVVTFHVVENEVVRSIVIEGNKAISTEEIRKVLTIPLDAVFSTPLFEKNVENIMKLYDEKGYIGRLADAEIDPQTGRLTLTIVEGVIEKIELIFYKSLGDNAEPIATDKHKTKPQAILRELETKEGEFFNRESLRRDLRKIGAMPMVEDVRYRPKEGSGLGKIIVEFLIKERPTSSQAAFGLGASTRGGLVGFVDVNMTNLGGMNRQAGIRADFGDLKTFEVRYTEPWLDKKRTSMSVSLGDRIVFREPRSLVAFTQNVEESFFEERRRGINLTFARPRGRIRTVFLTFRNEDVSLQRTDLNTFVRDIQSFGRVAAVGFGLAKDTRTNIFHPALGLVDPTSGGYMRVQVEKAFSLLGGDSNFHKVDLELRRYRPLGKRMVWAWRVVVGRAFGSLPAFEQFFVGGSETIRGYNIDHEFGDNQFLVNLELRYKLSRVEEKGDEGEPRASKQPMQLVLFLDWGDAWGGNFSNGGRFSPIFGFGVGFRVPTPLGPIRLDVGFGKEGARAHFGFGPLF
ncbi:MAG: BamA/TamA family outer membrane protein [Abditibacteriales bacterium]|nr:BamA/TamA family outer membrane protein [Abditibacteriales bacterium]MDW8366546.1 BamA/TamA family outer membrane protein [Abditibacteriales bacterium]